MQYNENYSKWLSLCFSVYLNDFHAFSQLEYIANLHIIHKVELFIKSWWHSTTEIDSHLNDTQNYSNFCSKKREEKTQKRNDKMNMRQNKMDFLSFQVFINTCPQETEHYSITKLESICDHFVSFSLKRFSMDFAIETVIEFRPFRLEFLGFFLSQIYLKNILCDKFKMVCHCFAAYSHPKTTQNAQ